MEERPDVNAKNITALCARLDRELWIVTATDGTRRGGLVATFVSQASIVPELPRMLVGIDRQHHTWGLIEASNAFALHLIGEEQLDWVWRFGIASGRDVDKLAGLNVRAGSSGSPILADALGWLDCRVEGRLDTGDRTVYLAEVLDGGLTRSVPVLTVQRMLQQAPADRLRQLKEAYVRDGAVDAVAIRACRKGRQS
jgi:flavin reductase (DIM6/NTAB) family NADH-FMN oxidoreductase RutF